jgi:DNA-binding transcriptional regulator YhcF (GntR family)
LIELKNTKKYELIAARIEEMILESGMKVGDRLSSVSDLTKLFNVAPATTCNSLKLLRKRKIIISMPRKGNFIAKLPLREAVGPSDFASYIEECNPFGSVFVPRRKTISVCISEYNISYRKQLWDKIFSRFSESFRGTDFKVINDKRQADVVLTSSRFLNDDVLDARDLRQKLFKGFISGDYYPAALNGLSGNDLALMPFAISQQMRISNCGLIEKYCPELLKERPKEFITYIINNYDYKSPEFPPLATFVHFLPLTLTEEGAEICDPRTGKIDFSDDRIPKIFEFNRCMIKKLQDRYCGWSELSVALLWEIFLENGLIALDTFSYHLPLVTSNKKLKVLAHTSSMKRLNCSLTSVQMLGVGRNYHDAEAAVDFIRFACGKEGQVILAESGCNIPVLRHYAESDVFLKTCPEDMRENLKELEYKKSLLDFSIYDHLKYPEINGISVDYYSGKITLDKALDSLRNTPWNSIHPRKS